MIIVIIIILLILVIIFFIIIYKIATSEGGLFGLRKNGFFFDPDTGAVGSFLGIEGEGKELVDVIYAPLNSPFTKCKIRNVPFDMIPKLTFSPEKNIAGVQNDGYMILGTGENRKRRLFDSINEEWNGKVSELSEKLRNRGVQLSVANKEKDQLNMGIDTAIAKINTRKTEDDKKGKSKRGGMSGRDMWGMDDDDDY